MPVSQKFLDLMGEVERMDGLNLAALLRSAGLTREAWRLWRTRAVTPRPENMQRVVAALRKRGEAQVRIAELMALELPPREENSS